MKKPPSSGPITLASPNTAPKMPWYLPRSRGDTTSPIAAIVPTMSPPPPSPWSARKTISWVRLWAAPHSAEPMRNTTSATCSTILRP